MESRRLAVAVRDILCATFVLSTSACGGADSSMNPVTTSVSSLAMSRDSATLVTGATLQLTATPKDASGNALSGRVVTWTTNASTVATISTAGLVTAVGTGAATITATSEGKTASTAITVRVGVIIGAAGGTFTSADGNVSLVVPAGALSAATSITAEPSVAFPANALLVAGAVYELGPTGTQFAQPVTVRIRYDPAKAPAGIPQSAIQLGVASQGKWVAVAGSTVDTVAHVIQGAVTHFSTYGGLDPAFEFVKIGTLEPTSAFTICVGSEKIMPYRIFDPTIQGFKPEIKFADASLASFNVYAPLVVVDGVKVGHTTMTVGIATQEVTIDITVIDSSPPCKKAAVAMTVGKNKTDDVSVFRNGLLTQATADGGSSLPTLGFDDGANVPLALRDLAAKEIVRWDYPNSPGTQTVIPPPPLGNIFPGAFLDLNTFVFPQQFQGGMTDLYVAQKGVAGAMQITNLHGGVSEMAAGSDGKLYLGFYALPRTGPEHIFMLQYPGLVPPPATTTVVQVTSGNTAEFQPAISVSNQWLAYSQVDLAFTHSQIMITDMANRTAAPVAASSPTGFAFSPSWCGNQLYYVWTPTLNDPYTVMRWNFTADGMGTRVQALAGLNAVQLSIGRLSADEVSVCPK